MTAGETTDGTIEFERPTSVDAVLRAPTDVRFLELPPRRCVMIDGDGPPGDATFRPRLPGLYISLGNPRRSAPERLRALLRQPVA